MVKLTLWDYPTPQTSVLHNIYLPIPVTPWTKNIFGSESWAMVYVSMGLKMKTFGLFGIIFIWFFWFQPEPIISKMLFYGLKNIFGEKLSKSVTKISTYRCIQDYVWEDFEWFKWEVDVFSFKCGGSSFIFRSFKFQFQEVSRSVKKFEWWTISFLTLKSQIRNKFLQKAFWAFICIPAA